MKKLGRPFALLALMLAIPLIAFIAAEGIQWKSNSTLRQALLKEFPAQAATIENVTVTSLCENPDVRSDQGFGDVCSLNDNLGWMKLGAAFAACFGISMMVIIKLAGKIARKRRTLLLLLFGPGLHLTMLAMSGLALLYAGLGIAALYYGESALIGRIQIGLMLAFGIGAIVAVGSLIHAQLITLRRASTTVIGKKLERQQHIRVWSFVEILADRMNAERPQAIVAGLEPNFYVTEADVICVDGKLRGRTMYISLPLCRILDVDEFTAVLGHELGHYKGLDTRFSKRFFPIYRGASQAVASIASGFSTKGSAADFVLLPVFLILSFFLDCFSAAENEISRDRELAADNEAAKAVSARSMATSLVKIHAFSSIWPVVRNHMKDVIGEGQMVTNASLLFANIATQIPAADAFGDVSQEGPIHPTDTHPPLSTRLRNLNFGLSALTTDAAIISPANSAINLVDGADALEVELSEIVQALMMKSGEARPRTESVTAPATA